jgi:hypothetical protein
MANPIRNSVEPPAHPAPAPGMPRGPEERPAPVGPDNRPYPES